MQNGVNHFAKEAYPSRLLDLTKFSEGSLRLVQSHALPLGLRYATLSHCWGNLRQSVLLKGNLDAYVEHIPVDHIPKTFVEAVRICLDLDIGYLWIDSMCVV
jgi:hypothetical protein